ncbi:transposase [Streptomyces sp. S.PB5]|nr:transposase [Streptomyces sp. S.PB5]MDN3029599.1 transposase [Streptomyces sp. S.PB5]
MSGARALAETGDDRTRITDAKALQAYAGAAPVTRAPGRGRPHRQEPASGRRRLYVGLLGRSLVPAA